MVGSKSLAPVLLGTLLSLSQGCASGGRLPDLPAWKEGGRVPPRRGRSGPAGGGNPGSTSLRSPRGDLSLQEALSLALRGNPRLRAFSLQVRAAEARRLQAGLLPNPELSLEVEEFGGTGGRAAFRGAQTTLALTQVLQLGGKRAKREKAAALERDLAAWDFLEARIDVYARTAKAFVRLLAAQERLAVAREGRDLARRLRELSAARVRAGKASPLEETKAALQLSVARVALERARREVDLARRGLAALWGEARPRFGKARRCGMGTPASPPAAKPAGCRCRPREDRRSLRAQPGGRRGLRE